AHGHLHNAAGTRGPRLDLRPVADGARLQARHWLHQNAQAAVGTRDNPSDGLRSVATGRQPPCRARRHARFRQWGTPRCSCLPLTTTAEKHRRSRNTDRPDSQRTNRYLNVGALQAVWPVYSRRSNKSPASTRLPAVTRTSATRPTISLEIVVSIFMASTVNSFWPLVTLSPTLTAIVTTIPGIAAPISLGLAGSALAACGVVGCSERSTMLTSRG